NSNHNFSILFVIGKNSYHTFVYCCFDVTLWYFWCISTSGTSNTNGLSIQETAKKFNIGSNRTLSKWIEQYEEGGASSLESQKRG
ncbi:helix-turn-helix domain-containing protein, partial [Enterococcus faecium]|uniref:helix-turn-helix domain-containing protein n=1 Tax=Enterococcus faecium TaxID=1352 RepID=UPI00292DFF26